MRVFIGHLAGLLAVACLACGSDVKCRTPTCPTPPLLTVSATRVTGNTELTAIGQTSQLTLEEVYSDGSTRDRSAEAVWSSTNATVATVARGAVTAVKFGSATIAANYLGRNYIATITATPAGTFVFDGRVREPGSGNLSGVRVVEQISFTDTRTGGFGSFQFAAIPAARFKIDLDGYEPVVREVTPAPGTIPRLVFLDVPLQRTVRLDAGLSSSLTIAPNDVSYSVEGDLCNPCKLIRVHSGGPGTLTLRLTWAGPAGALKLWANNQRNSTTGTSLTVAAPTGGGQSIVYVGWTLPADTGASQYVTFNLSVD
jgi:hypothetical protein